MEGCCDGPSGPLETLAPTLRDRTEHQLPGAPLGPRPQNSHFTLVGASRAQLGTEERGAC